MKKDEIIKELDFIINHINTLQIKVLRYEIEFVNICEELIELKNKFDRKKYQ